MKGEASRKKLRVMDMILRRKNKQMKEDLKDDQINPLPVDIKNKIFVESVMDKDEDEDQDFLERIALTMCYGYFDDYFELEDIISLYEAYVTKIFEYLTDRDKDKKKRVSVFRFTDIVSVRFEELNESPILAEYHHFFNYMLECAIARKYDSIVRLMFDRKIYRSIYQKILHIPDVDTDNFRYKLLNNDISYWEYNVNTAVALCVKYARSDFIDEILETQYVDAGDSLFNPREGDVTKIIKEALEELESPSHVKTFDKYLKFILNDLDTSESSLNPYFYNEMKILDKHTLPPSTQKLWDAIKKVQRLNQEKEEE